MAMTSPLLEKRKHKRYTLRDDSVVVLSSVCGLVVNICEGGMAIKYVNGTLPQENWVSTIHCSGKELTLQDMPLTLIHRGIVCFSPLSSVYTQIVGVKFNCHSDNGIQKSQIRKFISALSGS